MKQAYKYRICYDKMTDKQIVEKILAVPHNEEAAAFLLYNRHNPLLRRIYNDITNDWRWFDDCVNELYMHLRCKDGSWNTLVSFTWRCKFVGWFKLVAKNKFLDVLPKLIENGGSNVSLDSNDSKKPIQISDDEESAGRLQRKVLLMEAINLLKDDDQRFVILKRLEGYNSKEIAILLQQKWQKHSIKKYNNKKELVIPDAAYVDVRTQRAKENLRIIIVELK